MADRNKAELIIAACAVLTSAIAVFIAWDQGRVMRAQQHGAVFPVLQANGFVSVSPDSRKMGLIFENSGVGPALIESVEVRVGDTPVSSLDAHRSRLPEGYQLSWSSMVGRAIAPGDEVVAVDVTWPRDAIDQAQHNQAAADWSGLTFTVCYCSVFDRCWKGNYLNDERTERVRKCERSTQDVFEDLALPPAAPDTISPELDP